MNSKRKCKYCKSYESAQTMVKINAGWYCSHDHAILWAIARARSDTEKRNRRKQADAKESIKTRSQWLREAQTSINSYVRLRDEGKPCISCDKPDSGKRQRHASHFKSVASNSALRFNLNNIHASCAPCNNHLSGNIGEYTPRLILKIGQDKYDWLLTQNQPVKYDIDYLKRLKTVFNKRVRHLRALRDR